MAKHFAASPPRRGCRSPICFIVVFTSVVFFFHSLNCPFILRLGSGPGFRLLRPVTGPHVTCAVWVQQPELVRPNLLSINFQFLLHPRYTLFVQEQTRTSLGPRAPPLASSFDLFSRRPHQQPHIPTCGLDCTLSKRSAWHYTHPTRSSLYILSRAERGALPTPRGKAERTRSWLTACSAWRICPQLGTFDRYWAVDTTPHSKVRLRSAWRHA